MNLQTGIILAITTVVSTLAVYLIGLWTGWTMGRKSYGLYPSLSVPPAKPKKNMGPTLIVEDDEFWKAMRDPEQRIKTMGEGDV